MSSIRINVDINAYCPYISESALKKHIAYIADNITQYAESCVYEDYNRKVSVAWDKEEAINLTITATIE